MVQYYPTSHQQILMPCSQIMEQLLVVQASHIVFDGINSPGGQHTLETANWTAMK